MRITVAQKLVLDNVHSINPDLLLGHIPLSNDLVEELRDSLCSDLYNKLIRELLIDSENLLEFLADVSNELVDYDTTT